MASSICFTDLRCTRIARVLFFDFSSAFDIVPPVRLAEKLMVMQLDQDLVSWIIDYLILRLQDIRLHVCLSDVVTCSTRPSQETVLSLFLFLLNTFDFCFNFGTCHLLSIC